MRKKSIAALIIVSLTVFIFAGGLTASAADRVTAYTTLFEEVARGLFATYEAEHDVNIEWVRLSTGETVSRLEAEKNNPQASIWVGGVGLGHINAKNKGLTKKYVAPNEEFVPDQFKDPDGYWAGMYAGPLCFVCNTNRLEELDLEAPTSWEDLTKPGFKNHVQVANPGSSGTAYNVLATMVQIMGEEEAFDYMRELDDNVIQYTRSGSKPGQNAAIGEITCGIGYAHDQVALKAEGYPVKITFPEEGTGYEIASVSLIKGGPESEQEAAKKLYNWVLGKQAAQIYADSYLVPFREADLAEGAIPIGEVNTIDQDDIWAGENKGRLVKKWNEEVYNR